MCVTPSFLSGCDDTALVSCEMADHFLACRISKGTGRNSEAVVLAMSTRVGFVLILYAFRSELSTLGSYLGIDVAIKEVLPSTEYDVAKYFEREWRLMKSVYFILNAVRYC